MFLRAFATLLATFWGGRVGVGRANARTSAGLALVVSHHSRRNKDPARMGHPASTIFRIFSCMVCSLRTITSIVRFWGLIARKACPLIFARLVVYFVGFSADGGIRGG